MSLITAAAQYSNLFVVLLGVGTVFFGLVCIIVLVSITGAICKSAIKEKPATPATPAAAVSATPAVPCEIPNRGEFVAAVSAALAEELGTDVSSIRIHSITRR